MNKLGEKMMEGIAKSEGRRGLFVKKTEKHLYCCPIGAAWLACFPDMPRYAQYVKDVGQCVDVNMSQEVANPVTGRTGITLWGVIVDLFDNRHWSRVKIAKWVGELKLEPAKQ